MKKLVLTILLILLLAVPVMADEVSVSTWQELSDAVMVDGRTIILTQDISTDSAGDGLSITGAITITSDNKTIDVLQSGRVFFIDGGSLTLQNVNLTNGKVVEDYGGAILLYEGALTVNGGNITNCEAEHGGAICAVYGEITMTEGNITDCTAVYNGDGILLYPDATMIMSGGSVSGIYVSGKLNLKNTPIIENLYLESENSLTVIDEISSPAEIYMTHPLSGKFGTILIDSDLDCFKAENREAVRAGNDLKWVTVYNITVEESIHGTVTSPKSKSRAGVEISLTITPEYGYELDTLSVDNPFTMPEQDVVVNATFRGVKVPVTFDGVGIIEQTYGSQYVLPATPTKSGYDFVGWFDGDTQISYVTKAEAHTVYARWNLIPPTPTPTPTPKPEPEPIQKQGSSNSKGNSKGTSIWLPATTTATPTPVIIEQEKEVVVTPIETTSSVSTPVPIIGLLLGLLFVLRRK